MKYRTLAKLTLIAAFAFGLNTLAALAADQQNLPPFKSQKELREWVAQNKARDEAHQKAAAANQQAQTPDDVLFYTGKPYVKELGGYTFRFRTYDPELQRWTTEDPSGFPDGPNASFYAPTPTSALDWMGLELIDKGASVSDVQDLTNEGEFTGSLDPKYEFVAMPLIITPFDGVAFPSNMPGAFGELIAKGVDSLLNGSTTVEGVNPIGLDPQTVANAMVNAAELSLPTAESMAQLFPKDKYPNFLGE